MSPLRTYCVFSTVVLILPFASCFSPMPVYRLTPVSTNSRWLNGQEVVSREDSVVDVALSFSHTYQGELVFEVEVENLSGDTILVAPEQCYAIPLKRDQDTATANDHPTFRAQNPEHRIESVDVRKSRELASYKTANAVDAVVSLVGLVGNIASIGGEKSDEQREQERQWEERQASDRIERDISHANVIRQLEDERRIWDTAALRKATLLPGEVIRGEVHLPTDANAKLVRIVVRIVGSENSFIFRQEKR